MSKERQGEQPCGYLKEGRAGGSNSKNKAQRQEHPEPGRAGLRRVRLPNEVKKQVSGRSWVNRPCRALNK